MARFLQTSMKMNKLQIKSYSKIFILIILLGTTTLLYLFLAGWRPNLDISGGYFQPSVNVKQTGMISAKSSPQAANVYLDGKLITSTNNSLSGIQPGMHRLKITKNGYVDWNKDIEVFPELVTDITAVLISQTPRIEPLTNTGATNPKLSYSLGKIAFFSKDTEAPGVWVLPLSGATSVNLFTNTAKNILKDTIYTTFSTGKNLTWSPEEEQILIELNDSKFYLLDLGKNDVQPVAKPNELKDTWNKKLIKKRLDFISQLNLPAEIVTAASDENTSWSPDNKKFIYKTIDNNRMTYRIYNMEKPLPVGEKIESVVLDYPANAVQPKISWYSDSFHLILTEDYNEKEHKGKVSIIRIDGTNKIEIYNNTLFSDIVYSSPDGEKLIILTSFKSSNQNDLYTLGIK
jgi:hypothetical protein